MKNKYSLGLDKNKTYILTCSFGPDSMALLDLAIKEQLKIVVAHVNYHKRGETSNFEQKSLENYCRDRGITCEVLDTEGMTATNNFQSWARDLRYNFFSDLVKKYNAVAVLVAHQQDDVIETYLMQKNRGFVGKNAGIDRETNNFGCKIIRPLLGISKSELKAYDDEQNIPYSIDESNLTDHYERNKIRHSVVEKMTTKEREEVLLEINQLKEKAVDTRTVFKVKDFLSKTDDEMIENLNEFFVINKEHKNLSKAFIQEIRKALMSKKSNINLELTKNLVIYKNYGYVYLVNKKNIKKFDIKLNKNEVYTDEFLHIELGKFFAERNLKEEDFPITVKNLSATDQILVNGYFVKVNRLFIDWKMPLFLRKCWPGVFNKNGKLVYIPRYRKDFLDEHKSKLIINIDKQFNFKK